MGLTEIPLSKRKSLILAGYTKVDINLYLNCPTRAGELRGTDVHSFSSSHSSQIKCNGMSYTVYGLITLGLCFKNPLKTTLHL